MKPLTLLIALSLAALPLMANVDVTVYGVRAINPATPPAAPGLTANCTTGSTTLNLSAPWRGVNGDGIVAFGCGPANSLTTPPAPIVTNALPATLTGTGYVVPGRPGNSVRCYRIAAVDVLRGISSASPRTCLTTGAPILGPVFVSILTAVRRNTTTTYTTSAHKLPVGCAPGQCPMVFIKGTSNDAQFGAWQIVASVPNLTSFTVTTGLDSRNGAAIAASGGSFWTFPSDHIVYPLAAYQYILYEGSSGAETFELLSMPANSALSGDAAYMTSDYYGPVMSSPQVKPWWAPAVPPISSIADELVTKIVGGAGTSMLTLASAPATNATNSTIVFDNSIAVQAAYSAAKAQGEAIHWPHSIPSSRTVSAYVFNAVTNLSPYWGTGTLQEGTIYLGDTLLTPAGQWRGGLSSLSCISFCTQYNIQIFSNGAYPGVIATSGFSFSDVDFVAQGNGSTALFVNGGSIPTGTFRNCAFISSGPGDYMSVPLVLWAQSNPGGAAGIRFENSLFTSGPAQVDGSTATPLLISRNFGELTFDGVMMNRRGMFFEPNQAGLTLDFKMDYEEQGGITPLLSFYYTTGICSGWVKIQNTILDTMAHPLVANLSNGNGTIGMAFTIDGTNAPSSGMPLVSGRALYTSLTVINSSVSRSAFGQNVNLGRIVQ